MQLTGQAQSSTGPLAMVTPKRSMYMLVIITTNFAVQLQPVSPDEVESYKEQQMAVMALTVLVVA